MSTPNQPKVTRFGADPLLDFELANKQYVDNSVPSGGAFNWNSSHHADVIGGATEFFSLCGGFYTPSSGEADYKAPISSIITFSLIGVEITTNSRNGASSVKFRINAADGNQSADIAEATTGFFQDVTNTDLTAVGDNVNAKFTKGGTTGAIVMEGSCIEGSI